MRLYALHGADDDHSAVQNGEHALHLGGKIHMARRIQQGKGCIAVNKAGLGGENGDAALAFQRVAV